MAISTPVFSIQRLVATERDYAQKFSFISSNPGAGSFLTQAAILVYDDVLRAQNSKPKIDVTDQLTARQKKAVYSGIKTLYEYLYGDSSSNYYDEEYFNLLKGYVGSYFYKEYDWFNTDQDLNIAEFAALNVGNALYQFIDAVVTDETIAEAYTDYTEQAMGVYRTYVQDNLNAQFKVRDELKDKRIRIQLYSDPDGSGNTTADRIVYAGFDQFGNLVVWDQSSYLSLRDADISRFDFDMFKGNVMWFMDELVGIESDWTRDAAADSTNAYGYVQFTPDSVATAVQVYLNHIKRFNERRFTRDWHPWEYPGNSEMQIPFWLSRLSKEVDRQPNDKPGPGYKHEVEMDRLTYDQMVALAFVHIHRGDVRDSDIILLSLGDIEAAKFLYKSKHHTNPDAATLLRLNVTIQPKLDVNLVLIPGTLSGNPPGFFTDHHDNAVQVKDTVWLGITSTPIQFGLSFFVSTGHFLKEQTIDRIFTDEYKAKVAAVKAANGVP
jgi:hypothetical protein